MVLSSESIGRSFEQRNGLFAVVRQQVLIACRDERLQPPGGLRIVRAQLFDRLHHLRVVIRFARGFRNVVEPLGVRVRARHMEGNQIAERLGEFARQIVALADTDLRIVFLRTIQAAGEGRIFLACFGVLFRVQPFLAAIQLLPRGSRGEILPQSPTQPFQSGRRLRSEIGVRVLIERSLITERGLRLLTQRFVRKPQSEIPVRLRQNFVIALQNAEGFGGGIRSAFVEESTSVKQTDFPCERRRIDWIGTPGVQHSQSAIDISGKDLGIGEMI